MEAALCAGKHRLSNLIAMVDYNKIQSYGPTREVLDMEPFLDKWRAFNFAATEVDGHDVGQLRRLFRSLPLDPARPTAIICHTVKGKGLPFAEGKAEWHHKSRLSDKDIADMSEALGER